MINRLEKEHGKLNIYMSTTSEVLDDIVAKLVPEEVPPEYIVMAKLTDFHGVEHIFRGEDLAHVLKHPECYQISDARIVLNVRKIKNDILAEVNAIFDAANRNIMKQTITNPRTKRIPPPNSD